MVWGGMGRAHRTPLYRVQGNLTGNSYRDNILEPIVIPTLQAMGAGAIFQDDNARPHRARVVNEFLQQQQVNRLQWPACSPDLNPIEHLWDELGRRVRTPPPPALNLDQLFEMLEEEWHNIPQMTLRRLVESMRQRWLACIRGNGGHTQYRPSFSHYNNKKNVQKS